MDGSADRPAEDTASIRHAAAVVPVLMAGGKGMRLWPLSRELRPKQFLPFGSGGTLLRQTIARLSGLGFAEPLVVCNEEHRFLAAEELRLSGLTQARILLEPAARGTAPALALAALAAMRDGADPVLVALAADHAIADEAAFGAALSIAVEAARGGKIAIFGIVPRSAETDYGYIETGRSFGDTIEVVRFIEKPDANTARNFLQGGRHLWNSGMFVFRASRFLDELAAHRPDILEACRKAAATLRDDMQFVRIEPGPFGDCPAGSVDCAVMENTREAVVVPLDAGWSDVGSWPAVWDIGKKDASGNVVSGDVVLHDADGSLIRADHRLVVALGVRDLAIIETGDAVLVAERSAAESLKDVVGDLHEAGRFETVNHRVAYRPWGRYDLIGGGERDRVKRITVNPGAKLSVQMHRHRAEHWVVVRGTARVFKGDEVILLAENESVYIPIGEVHALENPGRIPLELIEVQTGSYLGEDDIVRLEDRYGRE